MNDIIQQIVMNCTKNVIDFLVTNGLHNIGETARQLHSLTKTVVLDILTACLAEMNAALVAAISERRGDGLRVKEHHVPRTLLTELGDLHYTRTYFEEKNGARCYLLDHLIGVAPYERLSRDLCAALVQGAADTSMEKAAKTLGVAVSRQTVNNKVLALCEVCTEPKSASETPHELHLFADEDHVHMKNGRSAIVPLVTVTEGIDTKTKRHRTIKPVHFEGYGMDNQRFFEGISSFLHAQYDMEQVKNIYIHADGGKWIKASLDWLPNAQFVMDGFHLEKRLRQFSRLPGAVCRMGAIRKALREDDFKAFVAQCAAIDKNLEEASRERLSDFINFIQNHWESVVLRMQKTVCGSCTEPLVSHVLSNRLSRNPLAWSEHGLRQMAMLRIYTKNGGVVSAKDVRVSRSKTALAADKKSHESGYTKYRKLTEKQIHDFLSTKPDWSTFSPPPSGSGNAGATGMLKKSFGSRRNAFSVV